MRTPTVVTVKTVHLYSKLELPLGLMAYAGDPPKAVLRVVREDKIQLSGAGPKLRD
jgi:hypothetical protein